MATLEVTVKGKLTIDDDLVESFKAQETGDQIRGLLDEGQDFSVTVKATSRPPEPRKPLSPDETH